MQIDSIIDISHWKDPVDFAKVKQEGIAAVIAKATNGATGVDKTYAKFKSMAHGRFLWGSFHFGTGDDVHSQFENYMKVIGSVDGELACLDFEPNPFGPSMSLAQAREFVSIFRQVVGRYPVLYAGHTLKDALGPHADSVLSKCPLWLAQYGPAAVVPPGWTTWTLWQFTDGNAGDEPHRVSGVGTCDRSRFQGSEATLKQLWPFAASG